MDIEESKSTRDTIERLRYMERLKTKRRESESEFNLRKEKAIREIEIEKSRQPRPDEKIVTCKGDKLYLGGCDRLFKGESAKVSIEIAEILKNNPDAEIT